jgi:four helix bundle protein
MGEKKVEDLEVWRKAIDLTVEVYKIARTLPRQEEFGLISQMQRAAVSVPGSIADGFLRAGSRDKARFYNIGRASAEELRTYLILVERLGYPRPSPAVVKLLDDVCAMLHRLWTVVLSAPPTPL